MSRAARLGREEAVIEDQTVSGCMAYAAPVIFLVAAYFARAAWRAITGAESPIIDDSKLLNLVAGLTILGASLFFCGCALLVLVGGTWKTKMKFHERGLTLHGVGALEAAGHTRLLYGDLAHVGVAEKHHMVPDPAARGPNRDLLDFAVDTLTGTKPPERPKVYGGTEYTFHFRLKASAEPFTFAITLDRAEGEIPAVVERLRAAGVEAEFEAALEAAREGG